MKVTDEWLYEKMPIVDAAMVRQLEVCTQKDYVFSDKFRKRMKRLIQKEKYMYAEKQLKKIREIIAEQTGKDVEEITLETNVKEDLDADSLDLFQIINDIEDEFDVSVEDPESIVTVQDAVDFVEKNQK